MAGRTQLNSSEVEKLLKGEGRYSGVVDECRKRAEAVLSAAQAAAPVDTGDYVDGLHIEEHRGSTRTTVRVVADDWKSFIIEAEHGVLAGALDAAGGA